MAMRSEIVGSLKCLLWSSVADHGPRLIKRSSKEPACYHCPALSVAAEPHQLYSIPETNLAHDVAEIISGSSVNRLAGLGGGADDQHFVWASTGDAQRLEI